MDPYSISSSAILEMFYQMGYVGTSKVKRFKKPYDDQPKQKTGETSEFEHKNLQSQKIWRVMKLRDQKEKERWLMIMMMMKIYPKGLRLNGRNMIKRLMKTFVLQNKLKLGKRRLVKLKSLWKPKSLFSIPGPLSESWMKLLTIQILTRWIRLFCLI